MGISWPSTPQWAANDAVRLRGAGGRGWGMHRSHARLLSVSFSDGTANDLKKTLGKPTHYLTQPHHALERTSPHKNGRRKAHICFMLITKMISSGENNRAELAVY